MLRKIYHASCRLNKSEKSFLVSNEISLLRVARIGIMSLKYATQSDTGHPCIYLARTGNDHTPPAGPWHQGLDPHSACCPSCPVRKAMPKRIPAALQPGQNKNVTATAAPIQATVIMIEQDRCGCSPDPVVMVGAND